MRQRPLMSMSGAARMSMSLVGTTYATGGVRGYSLGTQTAIGML